MKIRIAAIILITAVTVLTLTGCGNTGTDINTETPNDTQSVIPDNLPDPANFTITVYQLPDCNCCKQYVPYLRSEGFQVKVVFIEDGGTAIREKYPVPPDFRSCHISVVEDYFVEGHVPSKVILTLLAQNPAIDGITLPHMPSGSPGMGGIKTEPFVFYALTAGVVSDFMTLP